jgi:hypothetical protein
VVPNSVCSPAALHTEAAAFEGLLAEQFGAASSSWIRCEPAIRFGEIHVLGKWDRWLIAVETDEGLSIAWRRC